MSCRNNRYFVTTPYGALSIFGHQPNSVLFPLRHSYLLSTPEFRGDVEWLVVKNRWNTHLVSMAEDNSLLREQGVFQNGVDTVGLKIPPRDWGLDIDILGGGGDDTEKRTAFEQALIKFAAMFSPDLATVLLEGNEHVLPSPADEPNPWTITWENNSGQRFHNDVAVGYPGELNDVYEQAINQWSTRLSFRSDEPYFYGDEVVVEFSAKNGAFLLDQSLFYTGTYRAPFRLEIYLTGDPSEQLAGITMLDTSLDNTMLPSRPFQYVSYPFDGTGWPDTYASPYNPYIWDTGERIMKWGDVDMTDSIDPADAAEWTAFQFAPNRKYNFQLTLSGNETYQEVRGRLIYRRRYAGI